MKLLTELTTLAASLVTVAICAAEGLDDRATTALLSASTEEVMALVWLGKSLLQGNPHPSATILIVIEDYQRHKDAPSPRTGD